MTDFGNPVQAQQPHFTTSAPSNGSPVKVIVIILAVLAVLSALVIGAIAVVGVKAVKAFEASTDDAELEATSFISAMGNDNASYAYLLTSTGFKLSTSERDLDVMADRIAPHVDGQAKLRSAKIASQNGAKSVELRYDVEGSSGYTSVVDMYLVYEADMWKVQKFEIAPAAK